VQGVAEREAKFRVDQDWALSEVMRLVPDGGHLDREVRKFDSTLLRYARCWSTVIWDHTPAPRRRLGDGLAVKGSERDGSHGTAKRLAVRGAARRTGERRRGSACG
jgi:hypothetical protein